MCDVKGCSLMMEIQKTQEAITASYDRVYALKAKLRSQNLTDEQEEKYRKDIQEVEKLLATNKKILKQMRKGNRTTFLVACAVFLIIFITWMLYYLAFHEKF